jgi:hypothetical protein
MRALDNFHRGKSDALGARMKKINLLIGLANVLCVVAEFVTGVYWLMWANALAAIVCFLLVAFRDYDEESS